MDSGPSTSGFKKRSIPQELQNEIDEIARKHPRVTAKPEDLDENKKRWLAVGICLHSVLSPALREYVVPILGELYRELTFKHKIDTQTYPTHLKQYQSTKTYLNYEAVNNNKATYGNDRAKYDYKIKSVVDLSKLFLQTHMAHYTDFDEICDSSVLMALIIQIDKFPPDVQLNVKRVRQDIRNPWTHCDFTQWDAVKYSDSLDLMEKVVNDLRPSLSEDQIIRTMKQITNVKPADLDDNTKRWLVVGICLHSVMFPALREYVAPIITNFYYVLTRQHKIDTQTYPTHLWQYRSTNTYLNYEAVNNNKATYGYQRAKYDYKIKSAADLSKLFLQSHMTNYTDFDETCTSVVLFALIVNINKFPPHVQHDVQDIRRNIRNPWAHCNLTQWDAVKYSDSFQLMEKLIKDLGLDSSKEIQIMKDLSKWKIYGQLLSGTTDDTFLHNNMLVELPHLAELVAEDECNMGIKDDLMNFETRSNELDPESVEEDMTHSFIEKNKRMLTEDKVHVSQFETTYPGYFLCDGIFVDCIVSKHLEYGKSEVTEETASPRYFLYDGIFVDLIVSKHLEYGESEVTEDEERIKPTDAFTRLLLLKKSFKQNSDMKEDSMTKFFQTAVNKDEDLAVRYILGYSKQRIGNVNILRQVLNYAINLKNTKCAKAVVWEITRRFSRTVLITQYHDIWPAFKCECKTNKTLKDVSCSANMSNIVIVAEAHKGKSVLPKIDFFHGIQIIYKEVNGQSREAMRIVEHVDGLEVANTPLQKINGVSSEDAKKYFTKYSKLSMISKSHLKSQGFRHNHQSFACVPCIQLFCRAKGLIPIGESHLPEQISSIQTDILEGYPQLNATSDIRIGARIIVPTDQANQQNRPNHQFAVQNTEEIIPPNIQCGTIGGFLKYHGEDAFLTCAHVICDWKSLAQGSSGIDIHDNLVKVFCPSVISSGKMFQCGQLAGLAFPPNQGSGSSIDAAIVKIDQAVARSYIDESAKNQLKSKYLHQCCLDWRKLGIDNKNIEVRAIGAVSQYQQTEYAVKTIDKISVDIETLAEACDIEYNNIKPAHIANDIHFAYQAVQAVSNRKAVNPTNVQFLDQIAMHKIKCKPGDSGMCIYVRNPEDGKLWCIGMAVATDPTDGCIITPLKAILKHFNYKC